MTDFQTAGYQPFLTLGLSFKGHGWAKRRRVGGKAINLEICSRYITMEPSLRTGKEKQFREQPTSNRDSWNRGSQLSIFTL